MYYKTLRDAFRRAKIVDPRASSDRPSATLRYWGGRIKDDFRRKNPDFQPLTNASNAVEVVNTLNHMGTSLASLHCEIAKLRNDVARSASSEDALRSEMEQMRRNYERDRIEDKAFQLALLRKVEKLSHWTRVPPSPDHPPSSSSSPVLDSTSRKRPHEDEDVLAPLVPIQRQPLNEVAEPAAAMDTTMTTVSTASAATATTITTTTVPVLATTAAAPQSQLEPPAKGPKKKKKKQGGQLERNYNDTDADGTNGGTTIDDIVHSAYKHGAFKSAVSFKGIYMPGRFEYPEKYNHCLDLLEAVATAEQRNELARDDLTLAQIIKLSNSIGDACMKRLLELEGKKLKSKAQKGYTGVGARVQKAKKHYPNLVRTDGRQSTILEFNNSL